jgi:hypothetical protein
MLPRSIFSDISKEPLIYQLLLAIEGTEGAHLMTLISKLLDIQMPVGQTMSMTGNQPQEWHLCLMEE